MRALVTNDDGIMSPGLQVLSLIARDAGLDVTVAAPGWDTSGAGASLTGVQDDGRLIFAREAADGWGDMDVFAVEASPALIVRSAVQGAFGDPPDVVLSGINNGVNTGHAVLHSGTVGAVLTASIFGRPAAAFSIGAKSDPHWETAESVVRTVLDWVDSSSSVVLNVNIPNVARSDLQGLVPARLAKVGVVQTNITEFGEGFVLLEATDPDATVEPGTDSAFVAAGYASFTALSAVCEDESADIAGLGYQLSRPRPGPT